MARQAVIALFVVVLLVLGFVAYEETTVEGHHPNTGQTSSNNASSIQASNTYLTDCSVTGVGGFEFRVVSDSNGTPVSGEDIKAVDRLGCDGQNQVVYIDSFSPPRYVTNFTESDEGWLVPDFPNQATVGGELNFTITYQGATYAFDSAFPPVGTNCVALHVPSGNVTTTFVMNGSGSYCS